MADVKSVGQQKVQLVQTEQVGHQKNAEVVKQTPKEDPVLTKGQQEDLKRTRNAESKFAESAIIAKTTREAKSGLAGPAAKAGAEATGKAVEQSAKFAASEAELAKVSGDTNGAQDLNKFGRIVEKLPSSNLENYKSPKTCEPKEHQGENLKNEMKLLGERLQRGIQNGVRLLNDKSTATPNPDPGTMKQGLKEGLRRIGERAGEFLKPLGTDVDSQKLKEVIKDPKQAWGGVEKVYKHITGVELDPTKEVDKLNSDGDTFKFSVGQGMGVYKHSMDVEVKQVGTPPGKGHYEMKVGGGMGVQLAGEWTGVKGEAGVKMEASTTYRFDNMKDLKEGLKHLNNVQVAQSRMMIASPDTLNRFDKESGVDKSMTYLKQHRDSVEWRGGGGFGVEAEAGKGLKLSSGGKAENVSGVRINFPHPPDRPNAKVTILNETNVSVSGGGSAEKGIGIGGEAGGEMKVGLERSYELPAGTDVNSLLNDPIMAPKKVLDVAKNEGKLSETKVQIEGKVAVNPKVGVGIGEDGGSSGVNTLPETGFNMEVTLPPGQKLPENFYLNLSRGDIPGAFRGISEDSTYTMKAYQTTKHGYDLEPGFDWEGVSAKSKVQHQRLDQEPIGKTKEGKISELDEEWNEIARQLELR